MTAAPVRVFSTVFFQEKNIISFILATPLLLQKPCYQFAHFRTKLWVANGHHGGDQREVPIDRKQYERTKLWVRLQICSHHVKHVDIAPLAGEGDKIL